jgi:hypothetical protein
MIRPARASASSVSRSGGGAEPLMRRAIAAVAWPMPVVTISAWPENVAEGNGGSWPITQSDARPVRRTSRAFRRSASVEINSRSAVAREVDE